MSQRALFFLLFFPCFCFSFPVLEEMSLEEKVGQLLMVHFRGEEANEEARVFVQDLKVGGIIYYNWSNGLHSPSQIQGLSTGLQKLTLANRCPIPLFIAVDQEGGRVIRLRNGFTQFPSNGAIGRTLDPSLAKQAALVMGREMQAVGVNVNFAPVVDIHSNPQNRVIGDRSFGDCPEEVVRFAKLALDGYKEAQVISVIKHFPGHGDTEMDSHEDLPVLTVSKEEWEKREAIPFARLSSFAEGVMTAHILVPCLDPKHCSTLSEETLGFLRKELGFNGVIFSDSLIMEGVLKQAGTIDEAAFYALKAGCDVLVLGGRRLLDKEEELTLEDVRRIHRFLCNAVKKGDLLEKKIDESIHRILQIKKQYIQSHTNCEK